MKTGSLVVSKHLKNNEIFDLNGIYNQDNRLSVFYYLKNAFLEKNFLLSTDDINSIDSSDIVIYIDMPKKLPKKENMNKSYLIIFESEIIRPDNWNVENHKYFKKIFTWNDEYVDNNKYIKLNYPQIPICVKYQDTERKLITLISGNKYRRHKHELYSERLKAIKWFDKKHPTEFDFYGVGWEKYIFRYRLKKLNKITPLTYLFAKKYATYKGRVDSKINTLSKYKFSICYENASSFKGYITEKIFDSLFACCIPIYLGAPNIKEYIPEKCFIDKREFSTYNSLYSYLKNMKEEEYNDYIESITAYISNINETNFSYDFFINTIIDNCI